MSIHKKILEVMRDIEYLKKDDSISFGTTSYKGLSEEKVTGQVRKAMVDHGIIVYPIKQVHSREGKLSTVDVTYRFVDTEDDTFIDAMSSGTGADTQDKGVGKAMTYAYKYLFLRTFAIPTGEDPDKVSSAELDDQDAKRAKKHLAKRADEGRDKIKQMVIDYEQILPGDELEAVSAELETCDTFEKVTSLYRRFSARCKKYEIESNRPDINDRQMGEGVMATAQNMGANEGDLF